MRLLPALFACILPLAVQAAPILPEPLMKTIKADPAGYLDSVAQLIAAYGTSEGALSGITSDEVANSIALQRSKARMSAIVPLMAADLNADGVVARDEVVAAEAAASALARARMERNFLKADANGDGTVSAEELSDLGQAAALSAFSPAKMAGLKVLMGFDADGNGMVTLNEVRDGLTGLAS